MQRPAILLSFALFLSSLVGSDTALSSPVSPDTKSPQTSSSSSRSTTVSKSGDTLAKIAERFGVPAADLAKLNGIKENVVLRKGTKIILPASEGAAPNTNSAEVVGNTITLADGYKFQADEVWKNGDELWYRKGNVTRSLEHSVKSITPIYKEKIEAKPAAAPPVKPSSAPSEAVWIYLVGGARFRADEVQETNDGAWYNRNNVSIFLPRERIDRIERGEPISGTTSTRNLGWTSGNANIDHLIRTHSVRNNLDPYLVFLVIEQESQFHVRALSPKGARGLMQLMPGTARRLGVTRPFDAAENIRGGTKYLRELMDMFGGQVNLVLASYNAGEGAVMKYGRNVPPYKETREYVKKIGKRYGMSGRKPTDDNDVPSPER